MIRYKRKLNVHLLLVAFLIASCNSQTVHFDEYQFEIASKFKVKREKNNENVLLTLQSKDGVGVIIQNKLNLLTTTLLSSFKDDELLLNMHTFKFASYIKTLNGYDLSEVELKKLENVYYTKQTFKYEENQIEVTKDIRIIKLNGDFYSIYGMIFRSDREENHQVLDKIIKSINDLNST